MVHGFKSMISEELLQAIREQYRLDWQGIHGYNHMLRVYDNGVRLAGRTGARREVVELFAFLHDSQRRNDSRDPEHGARAAEFASSLNGSLINLDEVSLRLLEYACGRHTEGLTHGDVTVLTCWDADRLDLGRAGIAPRPEKLCTDAAKSSQMIAWAYERSLT